MAEELSFCYESLSAIFRCSAELGRTHDVKEFAQRLLSDLAQITSADWFHPSAVISGWEAAERIQCFGIHVDAAKSVVAGRANSTLARTEGRVGPAGFLVESGDLSDPADPLSALKSGALGLIHPFSLGEQLIGTIAVGKAARQPQFYRRPCQRHSHVRRFPGHSDRQRPVSGRNRSMLGWFQRNWKLRRTSAFPAAENRCRKCRLRLGRVLESAQQVGW